MKTLFILCFIYQSTTCLSKEEVPCPEDCDVKEIDCECGEETLALICTEEKLQCVKAVEKEGNCEYKQQCVYNGNNTYCIDEKCKCEAGWVFSKKERKCFPSDNKSARKPWKDYVPLIFGVSITSFIIVTLAIYIYRLKKRKKKAKATAVSFNANTSTIIIDE